MTPAMESVAHEVAHWLPDGPILVALSGGADSAVLAWAVAAARPVRAVSVDHGLPGSGPLMAAAAQVAAALGLDHSVVAAAAASDSETELRAVRLAALEGALLPGETLVTGHTGDDQAETVLGNVLRGTGVSGLAGIPRRRGRWVRPMLGLRRSEVRAVARELGLPFVDDPQNDVPDIRRNRLRTVTLPALADTFNPGLVEALMRLGSAAAADDAVLEQRAAAVPVRRTGSVVRVPAAALQTVPVPVAVRVARRALREARGPHGGDAAEIGAVLDAARGGRATVGGAVDVMREGPWVVLVTPDDATTEPVDLIAGGATVWGAWRFATGGTDPVFGRWAAAVAAGDPLVVRAARADDRIDIGGGSKTVLDALAEAAVPPRVRSQWPVVESGGRIVWIAGVRTAPPVEGPTTTVRAVRRTT